MYIDICMNTAKFRVRFTVCGLGVRTGIYAAEHLIRIQIAMNIVHTVRRRINYCASSTRQSVHQARWKRNMTWLPGNTKCFVSLISFSFFHRLFSRPCTLRVNFILVEFVHHCIIMDFRLSLYTRWETSLWSTAKDWLIARSAAKSPGVLSPRHGREVQMPEPIIPNTPRVSFRFLLQKKYRIFSCCMEKHGNPQESVFKKFYAVELEE